MTTPNAPTVKPIEIFKAGSFIAHNGTKHTFSEAQVREIAESYNPEFADAPFVVGHPKTTSPRFGHAAGLYVNSDGVLCATPADVAPEFAEAVNAKHYPKISASIYLPTAPGNPTPGKFYLRHIGFLGGAAPAVKGLKSVEFAGDDEGIVSFSYEDTLVVRMFRRLRDWLVATQGIDKAQEVISDYDLEYLASEAARESDDSRNAVPGFSAPPTPQENDLTIDAQKLAQKETELAAREAKLAKKENELARTSVADFAEGLINAGQLLPADKDSVVEILLQLDSANQVADFAEGDANHGKTGADLFRAFLSAQPKQIEFGRVTKPGGQSAGTADFAAPEGEQVDQEGLATMAKANAYMKDNPGVTFMDAVKEVTAA